MKYIAYVEYIESAITLAHRAERITGQNIMEHKIEFRIDEVLRRREQSLYWLSRTTGISYTTLWRLNKDRSLGINFATLEKLCVALECQPGDLMRIGTDKQKAAKKRLTSTRAVRRTSSLL